MRAIVISRWRKVRFGLGCPDSVVIVSVVDLVFAAGSRLANGQHFTPAREFRGRGSKDGLRIKNRNLPGGKRFPCFTDRMPKP